MRAASNKHVTEFEINAEYISHYTVQKVGGAKHLEYWIPAEELENFNRKIPVGVVGVSEHPQRRRGCGDAILRVISGGDAIRRVGGHVARRIVAVAGELVLYGRRPRMEGFRAAFCERKL